MPTDWRQAVTVAANLVGSNPKIDDDEWVTDLQKSGLTEDEACVTVAMVPFAFGRAFLIETGMTRFGDTFLAYDEHNRQVRLKFSSQPVFQEATAFALAASHHGALDRKTFLAIASRSVEVKIVLHVRDKGDDIDASKIASGVASPSSLFVAERPWWRFW
jgi:imidazoleglycerol phosphate dehydratase HisB